MPGAHRLCAPFILALSLLGCPGAEKAAAPDPAPTRISDRGVQEHGKIWPRSIDSAYMGTWGDNRNSGSTLVTSFEQRRLAGQSEYLSWTQPNSPPVSALMTNGSTEAPNGLIIVADRTHYNGIRQAEGGDCSRLGTRKRLDPHRRRQAHRILIEVDIEVRRDLRRGQRSHKQTQGREEQHLLHRPPPTQG